MLSVAETTTLEIKIYLYCSTRLFPIRNHKKSCNSSWADEEKDNSPEFNAICAIKQNENT